MLDKLKPIIIQGAMEMEVEELLKNIKIEKENIIHGFKFYFGKLDNYPIIVSETQIGIINVSMATCIAIQEFNPIAILNQGVAGSHIDYIHRNNIVIGEKSVNINSFITGIKNKNEGTNPYEWEFDNRSFEVNCDKLLLEIAKKYNTNKYNIFYGTLGSGDIFNREIDRIKWIQNKKNTACEDNESIAVYTICERFRVPCIGFRTITNNEITQKESDGSTSVRKDLEKRTNQIISKHHDSPSAIISQNFTLDYTREFIKNSLIK